MKKLRKRQKAIKSIKGTKRRKRKRTPLLRPPVHSGGIVDLLPVEVKQIARTLGDGPQDLRTAKRLWTLKQTLGNASLPELVTYDWLKQKGIPFIWQAQLFGGRAARGGVVPDFILSQGQTGMAWAINGEYWHSLRINEGKDATTRLRVLGAVYEGIKITEYVELWEKDVYEKRPMIFNWALAGVGLRG